MTEITADTLNDLATKLEELDLGVEERAVLDKILERASALSDETMGFVASEDELIAAKSLYTTGTQSVHSAGPQGKRAGLSPMALKLGSGAGLWG